MLFCKPEYTLPANVGLSLLKIHLFSKTNKQSRLKTINVQLTIITLKVQHFMSDCYFYALYCYFYALEEFNRPRW